jgi:chromosomal replication initiator protein
MKYQSSIEKIAAIQSLVAQSFNIELPKLLSSSRTGEIAYIRQISMYLCRFNTTASLKVIASEHNRTNHGTVIHASEVIGFDYRKKENVRNQIIELENQIKAIA